MSYHYIGSYSGQPIAKPLPTGATDTAGSKAKGWLYALAIIGIGLVAVKMTGKKRKNPRKRRNQAARFRRRRGGKWISKAIKRPGALRSWVKRRYGSRGFDSQGRIKTSILRAHYHDPGTLGKRVRLAMTLRRM